MINSSKDYLLLLLILLKLLMLIFDLLRLGIQPYFLLILAILLRDLLIYRYRLTLIHLPFIM